MSAKKWVRIPANVTDEADRRALTGILSAYGLEVRIVRIKSTNRGTPKRYVEYRDTGLATPQIIPEVDVKTSETSAS
jgi:hypothetical protein